MLTSADKKGRIFIPKILREKLGITPDTPLNIIQEENRIIIESMQETMPTLNHPGVFVVIGGSHSTFEKKSTDVNENHLN